MPLVSIGNPGIFRFEPDRMPNEPLVYAHLSNTQWGTNFPQWLEGDFSWRIRLDSHGGNQFQRLWWMKFERHDLRLFINEPDGLVLQSIKPRHEGKGLIVRYWNARGLHDDPILLLNDSKVSDVWRCDLMENPLERLQLDRNINREDNTISVNILVKPYSIETLLIEFDKQ
jgi:hypothetical protein